MKPQPTPEKLLSRAAALCARSEHCRADIRQKLYSWGAQRDWVDDLLDRLVDTDYINETRYARAFVHDKIAFSQWGRQKVRAALEMKHIDSLLIEEAMESVDEAEYAEMVKQVLERKLQTLEAATPYEQSMKLLRFAASRGYESDLVFRLVESL